jgi:hypothetical protein
MSPSENHSGRARFTLAADTGHPFRCYLFGQTRRRHGSGFLVTTCASVTRHCRVCSRGKVACAAAGLRSRGNPPRTPPPPEPIEGRRVPGWLDYRGVTSACCFSFFTRAKRTLERAYGEGGWGFGCGLVTRQCDISRDTSIAGLPRSLGQRGQDPRLHAPRPFDNGIQLPDMDGIQGAATLLWRRSLPHLVEEWTQRAPAAQCSDYPRNKTGCWVARWRRRTRCGASPDCPARLTHLPPPHYVVRLIQQRDAWRWTYLTSCKRRKFDRRSSSSRLLIRFPVHLQPAYAGPGLSVVGTGGTFLAAREGKRRMKYIRNEIQMTGSARCFRAYPEYGRGRNRTKSRTV